MLDFLRRTVSDALTGEPSTKRLAYFLVIVSALFWLTKDLIHAGIREAWNVAFGLLLGAVTSGYIIGKATGPQPPAGGQP